MGSQLLWIIDIYGFLVAGSLITMGTLGDRIGRRRLLLIGAAAFGIASVLAAFSASAEMLIATRALLGIAGATLAPPSWPQSFCETWVQARNQSTNRTRQRIRIASSRRRNWSNPPRPARPPYSATSVVVCHQRVVASFVCGAST